MVERIRTGHTDLMYDSPYTCCESAPQCVPSLL